MTKKYPIENMYHREELHKDLSVITYKAYKTGYIFNHKDAFALGYMCGKYNVKRLIDNNEEVLQACRKYDDTDDLAIFDTIGETLIDLGIIRNDGRI